MIRSIVLVLCAAMALTGCLEYESRIKVRPDGSGILMETVKFSEETAAFMRSIDESMADSVSDSFFDEEKLRRKAVEYGEGVSYVSGEKVQENGKIGYVAVYAFTNVEKLMLGQKNLADQFPGGDAITDNPTIDDDGPADRFSFAFSRGNPSTLRIRVFPEGELEQRMEEVQQEPMEEAESLSDSLQDSYLRMMKVFMGGMKMNFVVEPMGSIVETNASYRDSTSITLFALDFDKLLADDKALKALVEKSQESGRPESLEDVKRLVKGIPGFTAEFDEVVIRFRE